jgi:3D (Asp-Asp-Asp) domain-containing protein
MGGAVIEVVRGSVALVTDLVAEIVGTIKHVASAALMLAAGCEPGTVQPEPAVGTVEPARPEVAADDDEPKQLGTFGMTFYYVVGEDEVHAKLARKAAANANRQDSDAELVSVSHDRLETVTLYEGKTCEPIAEVAKEFASQLALQGTGRLRDGRTLNVWGLCNCDRSPCFKETGTRWGIGGSGRALQPFRTVAVDRGVIKLGSLLYIPSLEGRTMPGRTPWGGFIHDGCVVADDTGGGIKGHQLDLFVGKKPYVDSLSRRGGSHAWARHVAVFDGSKLCQRNGRRVGRKAATI